MRRSRARVVVSALLALTLAGALLAWAAPVLRARPLLGSTAAELDLITEYRTLDELDEEATDLVLVETTGTARTETIGRSPFPVTQARVLDSDDGPLVAGDLVEVRQDGMSWSNASPVLKGGRTYLLALHPWTLTDDDDTGQHWVTGSQAVWQVTGGRAARTSYDSPLPSRVSIVRSPAHGDGQLSAAPTWW